MPLTNNSWRSAAATGDNFWIGDGTITDSCEDIIIEQQAAPQQAEQCCPSSSEEVARSQKPTEENKNTAKIMRGITFLILIGIEFSIKNIYCNIFRHSIHSHRRYSLPQASFLFIFLIAAIIKMIRTIAEIDFT